MHQPFETSFATESSDEDGLRPASGVVQIDGAPTEIWQGAFSRFREIKGDEHYLRAEMVLGEPINCSTAASEDYVLLPAEAFEQSEPLLLSAEQKPSVPEPSQK